MGRGHMPLRSNLGSCRTCRDLRIAYASLWRRPQGLSRATWVPAQKNHTSASRVVADTARWCTWGVAIPALGLSRHFFTRRKHPQRLQQQQQQQARGLARPAVATQENSTKHQELGFWLALLAYVIFTQLHQRSLRGLMTSGIAPPSLVAVISLHAFAFLIAALFTGVGEAGATRRTFVVPLAVLITEVFSWEALGRLRGTMHLALSAALFSGLMLPLCMAASRLLIGRRFSLQTWAGSFMVAAGVAFCNLGNSLSVANMSEAVLLGVACCLPCLSLVGKEALMAGNHRFSIPMVGLLICVAQLLAIVRPRNWPPTFAVPPMELSALWHSGPLAYILVSGLLRVSLLVFIRASSASTLQLVNAITVPLGAAIFTSGQQRNVEGLSLALGGTALYLLGRQRPQAGQRMSFMDDLRKEKKDANSAGQRMNFMGELKKDKKEWEKSKTAEAKRLRQAKERVWLKQQEANGRRLEAQQRQQKQQERLRRLQARWSQQEERQQDIEGQRQPPEPLMYADE